MQQSQHSATEEVTAHLSDPELARLLLALTEPLEGNWAHMFTLGVAREAARRLCEPSYPVAPLVVVTDPLWRDFVRLRAWEHFDSDLDNPGGADSITEQAASVVDRMTDVLSMLVDDQNEPF